MEVDVIEEPFKKSSDGLDILVNVLTNKYEKEKRLKMVKAFRKLFVKGSVVTLESKVLQGLRIDKLVENLEKYQNTENSIEIHEDFLMSYSECIINFINLDDNVNQKLITQLEWIFEELNKKKSDKIKIFIRNLWTTLEEKCVDCLTLFNRILNSSTFYIEEVVFRWTRQIFTDDINACDLQYFVRLSGHLPVLFQSITSMFNQFIVMTHYNSKIIGLLAIYLEALFNYCKENQLNIYCLYPKDCCRLVSLLRIPPDICVMKEKVLEVLWESFMREKNIFLMLLTHFPLWLDYFFNYVNDKC